MHVSQVRRTSGVDGQSGSWMNAVLQSGLRDARTHAGVCFHTSGRLWAQESSKKRRVNASSGWHLDCVRDGRDCRRSMSTGYSDDGERCARHLAAGSFAGVLPGPPCGDCLDPLAVSTLTARKRPLVQDDGRSAFRGIARRPPPARAGGTVGYMTQTFLQMKDVVQEEDVAGRCRNWRT